MKGKTDTFEIKFKVFPFPLAPNAWTFVVVSAYFKLKESMGRYVYLPMKHMQGPV